MIGLVLLLLAAMINLLVVIAVVPVLPWLPVAIFCVIGAMIVRYSLRKTIP